MMMNLRRTILAALVASFTLGASSGPTLASKLVFRFTNPNFGGDPFISTYLLSQAQLQNQSAGGGGGSLTNPGSIGGPTIIIPISPGTPQPPNVVTGTEAQVQQVGQ